MNDYRCDHCGKFISYNDFDNGATHKMISSDTEYSSESWETICIKCNKENV